MNRPSQGKGYEEQWPLKLGTSRRKETQNKTVSPFATYHPGKIVMRIVTSPKNSRLNDNLLGKRFVYQKLHHPIQCWQMFSTFVACARSLSTWSLILSSS